MKTTQWDGRYAGIALMLVAALVPITSLAEVDYKYSEPDTTSNAIDSMAVGSPPSASGSPGAHERGGPVLGFNFGVGSGELTGQGLDMNREMGGSFNMRLGYAPRNDWAVGFEYNLLYTEPQEGVGLTFSFGGGAVTYYPGGGGFFVRGGVGAGTAELEVTDSDVTVSASETGFGVLGAAGYEWRLGKRFAIAPQVDFVWMDLDEGVAANHVNIGTALNWYF